MPHNILSGEQELDVLVFKVCKREFAIPVSSFCGTIPHYIFADRYRDENYFIEGVLNIRGWLIPVINFRRKFRISIKKDYSCLSSKILIFEVNDINLAVVIDDMPELMSLSADNLICSSKDRKIHAIKKLNNRIIKIINPESLISLKEEHIIRDIGKIRNYNNYLYMMPESVIA